MTRSPAARLSLLLLLTGCGSTGPVWYGYVYEDPLATGGELVAMAGSTVTAVDLDDAPMDGLSVPEGAPDGYLELRLDPGTELALRVTGPDHLPFVWRGAMPETTAELAAGALFGRSAAIGWATLDQLQGVAADASLLDGETVALWGQPLDPAAFAGAELRIVDGDGTVHDVDAFFIDADGAAVPAGLSDPIQLFLASGLAPGAVTLEVTAATGAVATTTWPARGGDMLSAHYFALPE